MKTMVGPSAAAPWGVKDCSYAVMPRITAIEFGTCSFSGGVAEGQLPHNP